MIMGESFIKMSVDWKGIISYTLYKKIEGKNHEYDKYEKRERTYTDVTSFLPTPHLPNKRYTIYVKVIDSCDIDKKMVDEISNIDNVVIKRWNFGREFYSLLKFTIDDQSYINMRA
jgi:hypothetical protein